MAAESVISLFRVNRAHAKKVVLDNINLSFLRGARNDVLFLELAARLKQDQRNLAGQVVTKLGADVLIRALRVRGHALQMRLDLRVVVDREVIGLVDQPLEAVVVDLVLPQVRHIRGLGRHGARCRHDGSRDSECQSREADPAPSAVPHAPSPRGSDQPNLF